MNKTSTAHDLRIQRVGEIMAKAQENHHNIATLIFLIMGMTDSEFKKFYHEYKKQVL